MQQVAEVILRAIASQPDHVVVSCEEDGERTVLTAQVDQADVARVIGRQGRTINAVRTVVKAAALKNQQQVSLELLTPDDE
ncbi:MAG TPA: KH domain-containing protein [Oscillatoriaceae cyanobacterium]